MIFKKLEDPSRPLLGPNVNFLKFWGLLVPENLNMKYFYLFIHSFVILFIVTQYIDLWLVRTNMDLLLRNLKITLLTTVSLVKFTTFMIWQKDWVSIIDYVTTADIENRKKTNPKNVEIIDKFTRYCRRMNFLQCALMYMVACVVIFQPVLMYISFPIYRQNVKNGTEPYFQVVSNWVPFDKNTLPGILATSFFQDFMVICGGTGWISPYDSITITIMVFFKGELELLRSDCSEIFGTKTDPVTDEEAVRRKINKCHERHVLLSQYAKLFNSCLSPVMFFYMMVCSFMLCFITYNITMDTSLLDKVSNVAYLSFSVAQLFIYCWHANDVFYASTHLMHGPYESLWWITSVKLRRTIFILTAQFQTLIIFSAGPFIDLTVATFINIMKGAYSYYTLFSQNQK